MQNIFSNYYFYLLHLCLKTTACIKIHICLQQHYRLLNYVLNVKYSI